jgi:ATP phosphoribosyltransferase regulatory subunit
MKLPELVGGVEIFNDIRSIFVSEKIDAYLSELEDVIAVLESYGVSENLIVDLSEIRGMVYHKGFFFEVFVEGVGRRIAVGGRYDDLMRMYGTDEPALGFAFNLEDLFSAIFLKGKNIKVEGLDVLVIDLSEVKITGQRIAKQLRERGLKVARDIISRPLEDSISYAKHHGIKFAVVIKEELKTKGLVEVHNLVSQEEFVVSEEELASKLEV